MRPLPPTGPRTASAASKPGKHPPAAAGAQPSPVRLRPRAAEPLRRRHRRGRSRLPGRAAGRRRGADRLRAPLALRPPRAQRPARLQADDRGAAAGDVPVRAAGGRAGQRRRPLRRRDRPPRPARDQHRSALAGAGAAGARGGGDLPRRRLPPAALRGPAPAGDQGRRDQRRDRRRLGHRQGDPRPLHARGRRPAPRLGLRGARRLLDPRAPPGDRGDRHLAAAPALVPERGVLPARARARTRPRRTRRRPGDRRGRG